MIKEVQCPQCEYPLEYKKIDHWSGNTDWFVCGRCLCEYLYDLDLKPIEG